MESKNNTGSQAKCIAVLGTGSDVGKSIIATALCRLLYQKGLRVAPFKAQNMSNNSGVTPNGLEMGRAQIVQAEAAKVIPHVDMNPILLKPTSEKGAQIVLLGKAVADSTAIEYHAQKERLFKTAAAALDRLRSQYDFVVLEGAGSCAEVNLMSQDIVNLKMASYADAPVILVGDIHKGGIFAQLVGTLACLSPEESRRISGFIINRFRGDIRLFADGITWLEEKTGKKVFGVLPWYNHIHIEPEDSVVIENPVPKVVTNSDLPAIGVIRLPHISNFNDFDPLSNLKQINLFFLEKPQDLAGFKAVILPGSKNTRFDLKWLKTSGWAARLNTYCRNKGFLLGICGGYQILGTVVHDPKGLEGPPGSTPGLGLLPVETTLQAPKTTSLTKFEGHNTVGQGYEIHMGQTVRHKGAPLFTVLERNSKPCRAKEGCISPDLHIMGTYLHGLFDNAGVRRWFLKGLGIKIISDDQLEGPAERDREYDLLADHFKKYIDIDKLFQNTLGLI